MKKILYLISTLFLFINCEKELDLKPKHSDFETDWELKNLFGKVKELKQFKSTYINTKKTEKPILNLREEFTEFGSILKSDYFDTFGNLQQSVENTYDQNKSLTKRLTKGMYYPKKMMELYVNDTLKKRTTINITLDDSLHITFITNYDKLDRITKKIKIENNDTIVTDFIYKFNNKNKVILGKEIQNGKDTVSTMQYKYDKNGNVIESINGSEYLKLKTVSIYKDNRVLKSSNYTIPADLQENLNEIIEYDKFFNPINQKIYENSKLVRELKNDYEFDYNGNWIKRKTYMKEHINNSKKFVPIYIENREIEYW